MPDGFLRRASLSLHGHHSLLWLLRPPLRDESFPLFLLALLMGRIALLAHPLFAETSVLLGILD